MSIEHCPARGRRLLRVGNSAVEPRFDIIAANNNVREDVNFATDAIVGDGKFIAFPNDIRSVPSVSRKVN